MKSLRRREDGAERGSVLVLTALIMVVLLGFSALVLDVGLLYVTRRQLQNTADAAALAGGMQLPDDVAGALSQAQSFLSQNDAVASDQTTVQAATVFNSNDAVRVRIERNESLLFGAVLGHVNQQVGAQATAIMTRIRPYDIWPWGLPQDYLSKGGTVILKVGARQNKIGNFMALDFPAGSGASSYEEFIRRGYHGPIPNVPPETWSVTTQTGNIAGPTHAAVSALLSESSSYPATDIRHPRVGIVPILSAKSWNEVQGKSTVTVVEFAAFLLTGVQGDPTGQMQVQGRFLNYVYGIGESYNIGGPLAGLIGVRLWE